MTIDEMRQHVWSVSWSGGKDLTATIILMHEYNIPIESIIYVRMMYDDKIPATLPMMTEFVDRAKEVFESWGYVVNIVPSIKNAKQLYSRKYQRSKYLDRNGKYYGITTLVRGCCNMTSVKQKTIEKLEHSEYQMIGYAADEVNRIHRLTDKKCSIMVELGIKEAETFEICRKYNLLSPLYDLGINRDGCWFCPNVAKREREMINNQYPELKKEIIKMIELCDYNISTIANRNNWVADYMKPKQYEQLTLFDFLQ